MDHEDHNIPEFMIKYYRGSDHHGQEDIAGLAKVYQDERATFLQTVFVEKQLFQRDWIKLTGKGKPLTVDEALAPMNAKYEEKAKEIAEKSGYQEKENEQQRDKQLKLPLEQPTQTDREKFLAKLKAGRKEMKQQQPSSETKQEAQAAQPDDDRQKILSQLKKMRENTQMTHRPKP